MKLVYRATVYLVGFAFDKWLPRRVYKMLDRLAAALEKRLPDAYVDSVLFK